MADDTGLILVVDDNEMNRDMLSRRLQRHGYEVIVAENGADALEMMESQPLDLVLLDIMMPKLNGYQVLEKVKASPKLKQIPVIMISAVDELDSVVKCIEMGAEDYLFKPFNPVLLKARVSASLDKKRLYEQAVTGGGTQHLVAPLTSIRSDVETLSASATSEQEEIINHILSQLDSVMQSL
jgi:DNA-binding response OmpR family regulator